MPSSMLFGINSEGRVYSLYTNGTKWREFPYLGVEFKRLSSVPNFLWAVGGDRQIYVHVHGFDIPIRIKEEVYENQRWNPLEGFVARLLPTDRYPWSNKSGTENRTLENIRLPSLAWEWESQWTMELTLEGQPLDHDGWTYAIDFPSTYTPCKTWTSGVRRRKWFRYRKYSAMNAWCAVSPLYRDSTQEPFIDVCVGGARLGCADTMLVWAVTAQGRVMFRLGATRLCPEGKRWILVDLPSPHAEVKHIACGPTGLTWIVLWTGQLFVRSDVTADTPMGLEWVAVPSPEDPDKITHVSVGTCSVWVTSESYGVWFRRGVTSQVGDSGVGTSWIQMSGRMTSVSVAPNDQVWAVGVPDQRVYYRSGVSPTELTGRSWRPVKAPVQLSRHQSTQSNSLLSLGGSSEETGCWEEEGAKSAPTRLIPDSRLIPEPEDSDRGSSPSPGHTKSRDSSTTGLLTQFVYSRLPRHSPLRSHATQSGPGTKIWKNEGSQKSHVDALQDSHVSNDTSTRTESLKAKPLQCAGSADCLVVKGWRSLCPVSSGGSLLGLELNPDTDDSGLDIGTERDAFLEKQNESLAVVFHTKWSQVEAGAVEVSPSNLPRWFLQDRGVSIDEKESWRFIIWTRLEERKQKTEAYQYENAIEVTSWVKSIQSRCVLSSDSVKYEDATIELEWHGVEEDVLESATIDVITHDRGNSKELERWQVNMRDVTNVQSGSEPGMPRIAMYLMGHSCPVLFQLSSDADHDDLLSSMIYVCCCLYRIRSAPSSQSYWVTTRLGEVLSFDPLVAECFQAREKHHFCQMFNLNEIALPVTRTLVNSFPPGTQLSVTGHIPECATRFSINLECGSSDTIALHVNPRFDQREIVRNHYSHGLWGMEDTYGPLGMDAGTDFMITILCDEHGFRISRNGYILAHFERRIDPATITQVTIQGDVMPLTVKYLSLKPIFEESGIYWRQVGGHLRQVETCDAGVTWGLGWDSTPWVHTGANILPGAGLLLGSKALDCIGTVTDSQLFEIYENQRWNPISGYSARGLPTDRSTWSDISGTEKRTKESCVLANTHWHWESDWQVDYNMQGGTDREGWQYALDFPCTFHAANNLTDTVRRRKWYRVARYVSQGPWTEVGNTKLRHVSLHTDVSGNVHVWGVVMIGDVLYRRDVSLESPSGQGWEHVSHDETLVCISGFKNQVWGVGENGCAYWRAGITSSNPTGDSWKCIDPPKKSSLVEISVGDNLLWCRDSENNVYTRLGLSSVCREGTQWHLVQPQKMKQICVNHSEVWGITLDDTLSKRLGVTQNHPMGYSWVFSLPGAWKHLSVKR